MNLQHSPPPDRSPISYNVPFLEEATRNKMQSALDADTKSLSIKLPSGMILREFRTKARDFTLKLTKGSESFKVNGTYLLSRRFEQTSDDQDHMYVENIFVKDILCLR